MHGPHRSFSTPSLSHAQSGATDGGEAAKGDDARFGRAICMIRFGVGDERWWGRDSVLRQGP